MENKFKPGDRVIHGKEFTGVFVGYYTKDGNMSSIIRDDGVQGMGGNGEWVTWTSSIHKVDVMLLTFDKLKDKWARKSHG